MQQNFLTLEYLGIQENNNLFTNQLTPLLKVMMKRKKCWIFFQCHLHNIYQLLSRTKCYRQPQDINISIPWKYNHAETSEA